jgi:simple sugar transport system ATP-binding protein
VLRLADIVKTFGGTRAVDDVSLEARGGEILALVGENGAGKTTLMRIAAGELRADGGVIERSGHAELVHQHFLLVNELTIAENLALTSPFRFATKRMLEREARQTIAATGIEAGDVTRRVGQLSVGEKSKLELIKAIAKNPSTLILDEPTAVLTPHESEELFRVMRRLAASGTAVVFISHKLAEVMVIAERVVVMRAGRVVAETRAEETTAAALAELMVERRALARRPIGDEPSSSRETTEGRRAEARRSTGTINAIVGVAGNGQTELASQLRKQHPEAAHIPEDRTRDGIIAELSIAENLALKSYARKSDEHARAMIELYAIRAHGPRQRAGELSGGNQQKIILARELHSHPRLIVAAEPTRGLDTESTRFVHEQLRAAASDGAAITLITSDLDEAFALADTIQVIYRGRLSEPLTREEARDKVANLMAGIT